MQFSALLLIMLRNTLWSIQNKPDTTELQRSYSWSSWEPCVAMHLDEFLHAPLLPAVLNLDWHIPSSSSADAVYHCFQLQSSLSKSCLHHLSSKALWRLANRPQATHGHLSFPHLPIPRATMETYPSWYSVRCIETKHISYEQKASASISRERTQLSPERFHEGKEANKDSTGASVSSWKRKKKTEPDLWQNFKKKSVLWRQWRWEQ